MTLLLVIAGAVIGAPLRYLTDRGVQAWHRTQFPWGTFSVNVIACLVLGVTAGAVSAGAAGGDVQALVGTGFCGALSTYSTFAFETLRLAETGARFAAAANAVAGVLAGVGAAFIGAAVAQAAWG